MTARAGRAEDDLGERSAFYALAPGGWRDYWTLLHPPYTLWHLSFVALGAAVAARVTPLRLTASLVAFFLAVGLCAHALDELKGRPLGTRIPRGVLWGIATVGLLGAVALGALGVARVSWWMGAFIAVGVALNLGYNLELLGGRLHSDVWFALAWGAFPTLTGAFAQTGTLGWPAIPAAAAAAAIAGAQRRLSTPVRRLRRDTVRVEGRMVLRDGREEPIDGARLRGDAEAALRALSLAMPLLAMAAVGARMG